MTYYDHLPPPLREPEPDLFDRFWNWKGLLLGIALVLGLSFGLTQCMEARRADKFRENREAWQSCADRGGHPVEDEYGWFTECRWD